MAINREPFSVVETEVLNSALRKYENGTDLMAALDEAIGDSTDSVEIISAHRRDTLRNA